MAISNHMIISRMLRELQPLQEETPSKTEFVRHIENVKLMCELLLENAAEDSDESVTTIHPQPSISDEEMIQMMQQTSEMTDEEYNVMIKGKDSSEKLKYAVRRPNLSKNSYTDHDVANGKSIFDF